MDDAAPDRPVRRLVDYRPPPWRVTDIALTFELDAASTQVSARLSMVQDDSDAVLVLDAEALELVEVGLDDRALRADEYAYDGRRLCIPGARGSCVVLTRVRLRPVANTALEGLYVSASSSDGFLLTQCEAEGFRRITPFPDRSDVLARYEVTLVADAARYPLLLANGDAVARGEADGGRHWARFVDPHPKPSYLFALVAGRLATREARFVTAQGRRVQLSIHADADVIDRCGWAMRCLEQAMRWDEERFGRCYDLDAFHVVATRDFTMGAMENKGLNVFNAKYLVADARTATDDDHRHVMAVVGHEYFHNWSGNRVTCRDWFQLCLKEGLTVYREQEFESDLASRTLRRIEDVRLLWRSQFSEDAGPLAHPVRPDCYAEINNFYTATVYEKGAEIVRMLAVRLGREAFRRGLDTYFDRHDGQAATVEQFLAALGDANGVDLSAWMRWYTQAGTPELRAHGEYVAATREYVLTLAQSTPPTPGQSGKHPLPIPVALALFDRTGCPLRTAHDGTLAADHVVLLTAAAAEFRFTDVASAPVVSLLRDYSAPVRLVQDAPALDLAVLARHETDGFNRWFASDAIARILFRQALDGTPDRVLFEAWSTAIADAVLDPEVDPALAAEMLTVADAGSLAEGLERVDPEAVHRARARVESDLARALEPSLSARYRALADFADVAPDPAAQGRRRLRNACLAALCRADRAHRTLAVIQFEQARTLTDRLAALGVLVSLHDDETDDALRRFERDYANDALVIDKWFALQATEPDERAYDAVVSLLAHPAFHWANPNNVYALLGAFALRNPRAFHRADGRGYRLVAEAVLRIDATTPQVAARLATAFGGWRRYESLRRALMRRELDRLRASPALSSDVADIVARCLADPA